MPRWVHCQNKKEEEEEGKQRKQLSHTVALRRALLLGINTFGGGKNRELSRLETTGMLRLNHVDVVKRCMRCFYLFFMFNRRGQRVFCLDTSSCSRRRTVRRFFVFISNNQLILLGSLSPLSAYLLVSFSF